MKKEYENANADFSHALSLSLSFSLSHSCSLLVPLSLTMSLSLPCSLTQSHSPLSPFHIHLSNSPKLQIVNIGQSAFSAVIEFLLLLCFNLIFLFFIFFFFCLPLPLCLSFFSSPYFVTTPFSLFLSLWFICIINFITLSLINVQ